MPETEEWNEVETPNLDKTTREKIIKLVDRLGHLSKRKGTFIPCWSYGTRSGERQAQNSLLELTQMGKSAIPFLLKGIDSENLCRATRCAIILTDLGGTAIQKRVALYKRLKIRYESEGRELYFTDFEAMLRPVTLAARCMDKEIVRDLIEIYNKETDEILRACLVWEAGLYKLGNRGAIPFLLKALETDPSRLVYIQARRSLLCLTGLFLGDSKEGEEIKTQVVRTYLLGWPHDESLPHLFISPEIMGTEWAKEELETRLRVVQKWKEWYNEHKSLTTTQWLKESFAIYTKEIENISIKSSYLELSPVSRDLRFSMLKHIATEAGWWPSMTSGSMLREWWIEHDEKIDFIDLIWEDLEEYYRYTGAWIKEQCSLLGDPRGLSILIEVIRRYQIKENKASRAFDSNVRYKKNFYKIYEVETTFRILKRLTGQNFGWDWRKSHKEKMEVVSQWEKWVSENVSYLYWSDKANQFIIDEEAKKADIPTEEYRKTHPWPEEK